jgi:hypothetical protein
MNAGRQAAFSLFSLSAERSRGRGLGRGGVFDRKPLSPALSPLVPHGEREKNCRQASFEFRISSFEFFHP